MNEDENDNEKKTLTNVYEKASPSRMARGGFFMALIAFYSKPSWVCASVIMRRMVAVFCLGQIISTSPSSTTR